ncbi:MAG TPA: MtrAB system histidine kinase MtrB [Cryptosporangiaceae bacterium]|nr:MtrAB system histidine kinase MtrB [Cryptosporangiaceae bacterium]
MSPALTAARGAAVRRTDGVRRLGSGAGAAGWRLVRAGLVAPGRWWALRGLAAWRRSLQLRVVTTTLAASTLVVVALGLVVVQRVADGLTTTKREQSIDEVVRGQAYMQAQLSQIGGPDDPVLDTALRQVVSNLSRRGSSGDFAIAIQTGNSRLSAQYESTAVTPPAELAQLVARRNAPAYQYSRGAFAGGTPGPMLVVAAPVDTAAGPFDLYYFFSLRGEAETLSLVQNSLVGIGVLLLLLLAGIAMLVTRQVVTPVRLAARTAERLSAGLLEERMAVRGEDDLARLAHSFNEMAANLQRQIVQLEDLSRLQRRFTSDVSHELRTPLTTVRMAADLLYAARGDFAPEVARSAELLSTEVDRFESLLSDLLEISRYDGGFAVLDTEEVDVRTLVTRVVGGLAPLAERAGTPIEVDFPDEPAVAEVDPRRVERILRNLVGNAIEHGEARPVRIALRQDVAAVAVTVRDLGLGLKPEEAEVVFNRFWRGDPSRARQTGGTGLGLSISREDARLHGGWLQAWGRPGQGAQFRLTLPVRVRGRLTSSPLPLRPVDLRAPVDAADDRSDDRPEDPATDRGPDRGTDPRIDPRAERPAEEVVRGV